LKSLEFFIWIWESFWRPAARFIRSIIFCVTLEKDPNPENYKN
jgi:hypothetical protein